MLTDKEQEEIRRKMLELEEEPPADGWSRISTELKPQRKPLLLWWFIAGTLLLLLSGIRVYYLIKNKPVIKITKTNDKHQQEAISVRKNPDLNKSEQLQASKSLIKPSRPGYRVPDHTGSTNISASGAAIRKKQVIPKQVEKTNRRNRSTAAVHLPEQAENLMGPVKANDTKAKSTIPLANHDNQNIAAEEKTKSTDAPAIDVPSGVTPDTNNLADIITDSLSKTIPADEVNKPTQVTEADKPVNKQSKEWFLGLTLAPRYAFRSFKPVAADEIYITNLNNRKELDPERLGYELGLNSGKTIKKNIYLETSLSLMQLRENVSYYYTTGKIDTMIKTVSDDGTILAKPVYETGERQLKSSFAYGGLRVGLTYFFLESPRSRLNLTVAGGMNLLLKGRTKEYFNGEWIETITFPSKENILEQTNYNLLVGAGYNTTLHNNLELMLMPSLNYFLGSTFKEREPFGLRPYTLGINVQIRRRFNK